MLSMKAPKPSKNLIILNNPDEYYLLQLILIENELKNSHNLSLTFEKNSFNMICENKNEISTNSQKEYLKIQKNIENISTNKISNRKKLYYKSDTILNIPEEKKNLYKTFPKINDNKSQDYSFSENKNMSMSSINNKPKQLSTSASNRNKINNESITKNSTSKNSFTIFKNKSFNVSEFDKSISESKIEVRNSIRRLDRLFEESNLINFNMDDFNQLRISFSNQNNLVNMNNSSIRNNHKINMNSFAKKKANIKDE